MQIPELDKTEKKADKQAGKPVSPAQRSWLRWLKLMMPDAAQLLLFAVKPNKSISLQMLEPAASNIDESIGNVVLSSLHRQRSVYVPGQNGSADHLAIPLSSVPSDKSVDTPDFILVIATAELSSVQQHTTVKLTQWAASRLFDEMAMPEPTQNKNAPSSGDPESQLAAALMDSVARHGNFTSLAFTLVNGMARLCGCARVSLGVKENGKLKLVAMSGQSRIDSRRQVARQLVALMQDAFQEGEIHFPVRDASDVLPSMQSYYKNQGEKGIFAFTLSGSVHEQFVLVLERDSGDAFLEPQARAIQQTVRSVAPLLSTYNTIELSPVNKLKRWYRLQIASWTTPTTWSGKRIGLAVCLSILLLSLLVPTTHKVSAQAYIEASDRQVLVSAQNGFIRTAHARAGDFVEKGALLATLDGEDLKLSADKWASEKAKNLQEYSQALAQHDRSAMSRLRADLKRIEAEIALVDQQLDRSEVRAPFAGVLMQGDWTQSLGAPVTTGDVLFQIASAEQYQLILEVDDHDIAHVQANQMSNLRMAALPNQVWEAELGAVLPVAISEKGRSAFRVPAVIKGDASLLRPGMQGIGKIDVGSRSIFWVYTHRLTDRLRYLGWKLGLI